MSWPDGNRSEGVAIANQPLSQELHGAMSRLYLTFLTRNLSLIPVTMYKSHSCFLWSDKHGPAWVVLERRNFDSPVREK
jgi:hypothetical protein